MWGGIRDRFYAAASQYMARGVMFATVAAVGVGAAVLGGCAARSAAPVAERSPTLGARVPATYTVRSGDSLYSIAWRYELDVPWLAQRNGLQPPFTIRTGQTLSLRRRQPASIPERRAPRAEPAPIAAGTPANPWAVPVQARPSARFGGGNKGLDYTLRKGQVIKACAGGRVVYAGAGLRGYRWLVIVKHDETLMSAYGLNAPFVVREGDAIKGGTILAEIEGDGAVAGRFHFEIRRGGKPVDPLGLIARRR